jgi:uncharacterized protein YcbK (DUF882 family)
VVSGRIRTLLGRIGARRVMVVALSLVVLVALTRGTQDAVANGDTRTLDIIQMHTGERVSVTFRRHGRYDAGGLRQLDHVMRDWRRNEAREMDPRLYDLLWEVHRSTGSRQPVHVVSAYRAPQTNQALRQRSSNVAENSQHTLGRAVDFYLPDVPAERIRTIGLRMQRGGVGYYPRANTPFVHLDTGGVRHWPRMNRRQLVGLFPDERTVHIPADGKPLAGFDQARREILAAGGTVMGETGTQVAEAPTRRRSLWRALFGIPEESETDMAEADALPARAPAPSPQRAAPAPAPAPAPPVAVAQAPQAPQAPQNIAPSLPEAPPPPPPAPRPAAASPAPEAPDAASNTAVAQAPPLPAPRPENLGPTMVWQQGPEAIVSADAAEGRVIDTGIAEQSDTGGLPASIASLDAMPIPPRRPASFDSIGTLVTAFADPAATGTASDAADPLAQLGLRGEIAQAADAPAVFDEAREEPIEEPITVAALDAPIPAPRRAVTETASTNRRSAASRDLVAAARDPRASWRVLFVEEPHVDDAVRHAAVNNGTVRYAQAKPQGREAPAGFVGVRDAGLALGFAKETVPGPGIGAFSGPAVAPLPVRQ